MGRRITGTGVLIAAAVSAGSLQAHHSFGMFDVSTSIWVKGTVVSYEPISPHAMILLEETQEGGQVQRWIVEGPFPGRLNRILRLNGIEGDGKDFLKAGDRIEVCGFDLREDLRARRPPPDPDDPQPTYAHGHVLVMPDGHMQSWGPYGNVQNCIRPNDEAEVWRDFLNSDSLAHEFWCNYASGPVAAPEAFIDDVDRLLADPCD